MTRDSGSDSTLENDAEDLYKAVTKLTKVIQFRDRDAICCQGVSVTQCYALEALVWHGPQSVSELASFLLLNSSTVSRVADALERKGLATRKPNPNDRRAVILSATEEGRRVCNLITDELKSREAALVADLEPNLRRTMITLVDRLADEYETRARELGLTCDCEDKNPSTSNP